MTRSLLFLGLGLSTLILSSTPDLSAQSPPDPDYVRGQVYPSYQDFKNDLTARTAIADPVERTAQINNLWNTLMAAGQVPYAQDGQIAFLYRGSASSVAWPGDFNGWNPSQTSARGTQLAGTDLWMLEKTFPPDARLDYKIVLNGTSWILDPANTLQIWSGFGPNSELRMPEYVFPQETVRKLGLPQGSLTANITTFSSHLGYNVNYRVYTPAGYAAQNLHNLPVVYVTDGQEYLADHLGSMAVVLDNLIADRKLQPTIAVFIDPRDPANLSNNRRASEYTGNTNFASFVADELVSLVDGAYRTNATSAGRTILGTSLGGVNSIYFGGTRSDTFENIAVQSPASYSSIFNLFSTQPLQEKVDVYLTAGTIGDGTGGTTFSNLLNSHGYEYTFVQANEGHSWGNWRALLDSILIGLVGPSPYSADFDNDLGVDASDLAVWQLAFGNNSQGDADGDGDSDGQDLLEWQRQFGNSSRTIADYLASPAKGIATPEPGTAWLLATLATLSSLSHRDRLYELR